MDMIHLLMSDPPGVDDGAETVVCARLARELARQGEHLPQRRGMRHFGVIERRNMHFRDEEEMHRRDRADVVESAAEAPTDDTAKE